MCFKIVHSSPNKAKSRVCKSKVSYFLPIWVSLINMSVVLFCCGRAEYLLHIFLCLNYAGMTQWISVIATRVGVSVCGKKIVLKNFTGKMCMKTWHIMITIIETLIIVKIAKGGKTVSNTWFFSFSAPIPLAVNFCNCLNSSRISLGEEKCNWSRHISVNLQQNITILFNWCQFIHDLLIWAKFKMILNWKSGTWLSF